MVWFVLIQFTDFVLQPVRVAVFASGPAADEAGADVTHGHRNVSLRSIRPFIVNSYFRELVWFETKSLNRSFAAGSRRSFALGPAADEARAAGADVTHGHRKPLLGLTFHRQPMFQKCGLVLTKFLLETKSLNRSFAAGSGGGFRVGSGC